MAGSYKHCIDDNGKLLNPTDLNNMIENGGDVYEAVEELYGMLWYLAKGNAESVEQARINYRLGLHQSPGIGGRIYEPEFED